MLCHNDDLGSAPFASDWISLDQSNSSIKRGGTPKSVYISGVQINPFHRQDHTATMISLVFVLLIGAACEYNNDHRKRTGLCNDTNITNVFF